MKKWMLLTIMLGAMSLTGHAQDDDMYFVPTKANVAKQKASYGMPQDTYWSGSSRSVADYNHRGSSYEVLPADTGDVISFAGVQGVYPDSVSDFALTRQMQRWDGYEPSQEYWDGYNEGRRDSWSSWYGWHSPWYYNSFYPWYDYGWYDPWYRGWYDPWYGGWYDPWYRHSGWGWGYTWAYRPYWYHGWYGGGYHGGGWHGGHNGNYTNRGFARSSGNNGVVSRDGRSHTYSHGSFSGSRTARGNTRGTYGNSTRSTASSSGSYGSSSSTPRTYSNPYNSGSSSSASSRSYSSGGSGGFSSGGGSRGGGGGGFSGSTRSGGRR